MKLEAWEKVGAKEARHSCNRGEVSASSQLIAHQFIEESEIVTSSHATNDNQCHISFRIGILSSVAASSIIVP